MSVKTQIAAEYGQRIGTDAYTLDGEKVRQMIKLPITGKPLKPCPFCGSKKVSMYDESVKDFFFSKDRYLVECDRCSVNIERYSITGVKRAWNRREGEKND